MTRRTILFGTLLLALAIGLVLLAWVVGNPTVRPRADRVEATLPGAVAAIEEGSPEPPPGFLYGRIATTDGATYEGRLRWGGYEEAFWGDYFNGHKADNPWVAQVSPDFLTERRSLQIFGIEVARRERSIDLSRPFMARFGDIALIKPKGRDLQVTLKTGTVFHLDRYAADDLADGLRIWDATSGVVDLDEWKIRTVELLPTPRSGAGPTRLHGTVRTRKGDFTGFVQWNLARGVGTDRLHGRAGEGELSLRFDGIRSIARHTPDSSLVTLEDGSEVELSGAREPGHQNRGMYVDDRRYGRVLVSWEAFERVDFRVADSGPAYDDFPPGGPLTGQVITRDGERLAGRLVYDLDESEITETLDAPSGGINYTIPFGLIASIVPTARDVGEDGQALVNLHSGEELALERAGDLGERNAGMLIFVEGRGRPEYVPWKDVERIELDRPTAMYPPLSGR